MTHQREGGGPNTDAEEAAKILRGLRERVENLEEERGSQGTVGVLRAADETAGISESINVTESAAASGTWGSDDWNFTEWGRE